MDSANNLIELLVQKKLTSVVPGYKKPRACNPAAQEIYSVQKDDSDKKMVVAVILTNIFAPVPGIRCPDMMKVAY